MANVPLASGETVAFSLVPGGGAVNSRYNLRILCGGCIYMKSLDGRSFGGTLPEWPIIWVLSGTDRVGWWVGCAL